MRRANRDVRGHPWWNEARMLILGTTVVHLPHLDAGDDTSAVYGLEPVPLCGADSEHFKWLRPSSAPGHQPCARCDYYGRVHYQRRVRQEQAARAAAEGIH